MTDNPLGIKSPIRVTVGFAMQLIVTLVAIIGIYYSLRADLNRALEEMRRTIHVIEQQQISLNDMRVKQERMDQNLEDFRKTYDKDFNRYIRDTPGR